MTPDRDWMVAYATATAFIVGLMTVENGILIYHFNELHAVLSEMNERQKSVVVTQHKAIEDRIAQVCGQRT